LIFLKNAVLLKPRSRSDASTEDTTLPGFEDAHSFYKSSMC